MSKGSNRRPAAVPRATVDANYERTFRVGPTTVLTPREAFGDAWGERTTRTMEIGRVSRVDATSITFDAIPEMPGGGFAYECRTPSGRADAEG